MLIILGVLSIVTGGILFIAGNNTNNDLDAQMESIFNDGVTNPGSTYESIGLLLVVLGVVLVIIGVVLRLSSKDEASDSDNNVSEVDEDKVSLQTQKCAKCGTETPADGKFCKECGQPLNYEENSIYCPHCGKQIPESSKFCMFCGRGIKVSR